ncbi:MAG TPA: hypothetical protein VNN73_11295 [Blastocatellia bacterium]|nr:hypothetical protein [Blastocatellia bacterium]
MFNAICDAAMIKIELATAIEFPPLAQAVTLVLHQKDNVALLRI